MQIEPPQTNHVNLRLLAGLGVLILVFLSECAIHRDMKKSENWPPDNALFRELVELPISGAKNIERSACEYYEKTLITYGCLVDPVDSFSELESKMTAAGWKFVGAGNLAGRTQTSRFCNGRRVIEMYFDSTASKAGMRVVIAPDISVSPRGLRCDYSRN